MGVSSTSTTLRTELARRNPLGLVTPDRRSVTGWAVASIVANTVIILTGGLVRLTGSGLGCPTWPRCTDESFVPHRELGLHGVIEFGNRMLTYVLIAVAVCTLVAVWRWTRERSLRRLAVVLAVGIPFQGVIGGITVLTDLNPWIVSLHLILSLGLVAGSTLLLVRVLGGPSPSVPPAVRSTVLLTYAVLWVAVYLGTVVTGSGPHAGDVDSPRNGLDPHVWSHVHAASVYVLVALTLVVLVQTRRGGDLAAVRAAALLLLVGELGQGTIGFVQYVTDLPIALVAVHLVGAALLVLLGTRLLLSAAPPAPAEADAPESARAV